MENKNYENVLKNIQEKLPNTHTDNKESTSSSFDQHNNHPKSIQINEGVKTNTKSIKSRLMGFLKLKYLIYLIIPIGLAIYLIINKPNIVMKTLTDDETKETKKVICLKRVFIIAIASDVLIFGIWFGYNYYKNKQ